MSEADIKHIHGDIEVLKKDISVIKHILSEEGQLTDWAKNALKEAREESEENYSDLNDL